MSPLRCYLVCTTQRSGSSLLCEALRNTGLAGKPAEYLLSADAGGWEEGDWARERGVTTRAEFLQLIFDRGTGSNGVFGSKLFWQHHHEAVERLSQVVALPSPRADSLGGRERSLRRAPPVAGTDSAAAQTDPGLVLATAFPALRYIWLTRDDRLRHAVSWLRAAQTGSYHVGIAPDSDSRLSYDASQIAAVMATIEQAERGWESFFQSAGVVPHRVTYEGLVAGYEATALGVLDFLDVPYASPLAFGPRRLTRQADEVSEEWVRRFEGQART
jgi:LPS sulfotransferase NodH